MRSIKFVNVKLLIMRKLFLSAIVLILFSFSIFFFQISCQKDTLASVDNGANMKIVYTVYKNGINEIWIANIDGSNKQKISLNIPVPEISDNSEITNVKISSDGSKIIFILNYETNDYVNYYDIYTCNINGSNLTKIISNSEVDGSIYSIDI